MSIARLTRLLSRHACRIVVAFSQLTSRNPQLGTKEPELMLLALGSSRTLFAAVSLPLCNRRRAAVATAAAARAAALEAAGF